MIDSPLAVPHVGSVMQRGSGEPRPTTGGSAELAIRVDGVSRAFGSISALDHLSFEVRRGTVFGFLGPNGAGKTTTIRLLLGLLEPDSGHAEVLGFDAHFEGGKIRDRSGALLGDPGLGVVTINVAYRPQPFLIYPLSVAVSLVGLALLGGLLVALFGVLISLKAATVRQAYQRFSLALILVSLPVFSLQYLPADSRAVLLPTQENWGLFALAVRSVLIVLDGWLLGVCISRFSRPRLLPT